jgi:O-antigen/teichoic acid export membrane protein
LVGLIVGILDRWLLQIFSGSVQQGFFGLSYQIGAICFLFTSAMTPLITREFTVAFGHNDLQQMAHLFRRYIPMLYAIAAFFSCFVAVQADKVTLILGGNQYKEATTAVMIMAFYPIHQTYGQLSGSIFYATGQTRLYRNIGIIFMLIGLPLTYFLIAPVDKMGLNTGATGLAIKMVLLQLFWVNAQLYFNSKLLKLPFLRYLLHQVFSVGILLAIAYVSTIATNIIPGLPGNFIIHFIITGIIYTFAVAIAALFIPQIFGIKRDDISMITKKIKAYFNTKHEGDN